MEIITLVGAAVAKVMIYSFRTRGKNQITYDTHSPHELDRVVGSVSSKRGCETVGNSIEILKGVFMGSPQEIRRFVLLLDGSPSSNDQVAHVEGKRGYFRGMLKSVEFFYKGSNDITGIIVYSRSYVQSGKVLVKHGGVGEKNVEMKVNLGDFVYSYKDIEVIILTRVPLKQSKVARKPRANRNRSSSTNSRKKKSKALASRDTNYQKQTAKLKSASNEAQTNDPTDVVQRTRARKRQTTGGQANMAQSANFNKGQTSRKNPTTSKPPNVLKTPSQAQQFCAKTESISKQVNTVDQGETSKQHRSRSKKRQATEQKKLPAPGTTAHEEDLVSHTKAETPEPIPAKRSRSRRPERKKLSDERSRIQE